MTFNEMKARFLSILNRDDCTDTQATIFLQDALARVARNAKLPDMERAVILTVSDQPMQIMAIPADLLQVIEILVTDECGLPYALEPLPYRTLLRHHPSARPRYYGRFQGTFAFRGYVPKGRSVTLLYYGEFSDFETPDSENEISASNPDLIVYGALSFAGDVFDHPSKDDWEARFTSMLGEVIGLGADLDTLGGASAVQSVYPE